MYLVKNVNANASAIWGVNNTWRHEISQLQVRLKCVTIGADTVVMYQYQVSTQVKPLSAIVVLYTVIFSKLACISPFSNWSIYFSICMSSGKTGGKDQSFFTCTFKFTNLYLFNIASKL